MTNKDKDVIWYEGVKAYQQWLVNGITISNPYDEENQSRLHDLWQSGWDYEYRSFTFGDPQA